MRDPKIIAQPTLEPVTAAQSWAHLRVTLVGSPPAPVDADDIALKLSTAREVAEQFTGRALCPQTLEIALDEFPADDETIDLLRSPVTRIASIIYFDEDGVEQVMDESLYALDDYGNPAVIRLAADGSWPSTKVLTNAVKVRYEAGFSIASDSPQTATLPNSIRSAILLILGHLYESREDVSVVQLHEIPYGAECLLRPYRLLNGFA